MKLAPLVWAFRAEKKYGRLPEAYCYRSLPPAFGEIVGFRLMRLLGIGTAPSVEILETSEACRLDPCQWIFKPIKAGRLKVCSLEQVEKMGRWTVAVQKIPRAIPLSFLRSQYGIDAGKVEIAELEDALVSRPSIIDILKFLHARDKARVHILVPFATIREAIWEGKPELPRATEFYSDFVSPEDWSVVKRAIAWDSDQMLSIHSARLFLAMSIAHLSNVLVDPEGLLYSVDHEFCSATAGEELEVLFGNVKRGTRAFEALRGVAELSEGKMRELFEGLPEFPGGTPAWFRWPMGSEQKTVDHYLERLRLWKKLFFGKVHNNGERNRD